MKRAVITAAVVFIASAAILGACELQYYLTDAAGVERPLPAGVDSSGAVIRLELGGNYILKIVYREDHRNCDVRPEDTLFLLDGARWRVGRETQSLVLAAPVAWMRPRSRTCEGEVRFTAGSAGSCVLEIIRECSRDGYRGELVFLVSE